MKKTKVSGAIFLAGVLVIAQYILAFFVYKLPGVPALQWLGWVIWVPALIFGFAPIFILRLRGGVSKGVSYVETTRLVDSNVYAIARHPQYLGMILFSLALMLLAQHWLVILLGIISVFLSWISIQAADQEGIEKFGNEYRQYMEHVPQVNFLLGMIRLIRRGKAAVEG